MARVVKEPAERRQEILDTALRLFYENGYEQTSIADIARALHIAQGLCYR
jgi:AcrR family transcriptional regulator